MIPNVNFGKKLSINLGAGIFYGQLLNQRQLIFTYEDLSVANDAYNPPPDFDGEVRYYKNDFGIVPRLKISYLVNDRFSIGLNSKAYLSQIGFVPDGGDDRWYKPLNTNWLVYAAGLQFAYHW